MVKSTSTAIAVAFLALLLLGATPAAAQVSGAIFTSDAAGNVNINLYAQKEDVHLNGGPPAHAPCTAAGLPDGAYYFQVTDPSGGTLLSSDNLSQRQVTVSGGVITDADDHAYLSGSCGGVRVQVVPFDNTPNSGCVYKIWVTKQSDYVSGGGVHGFIPSKSKTDNFRVCEGGGPPQEMALITGLKFYDSNSDGVRNGAEPGIQGWQVNIDPAAPEGTYACTVATGAYSFAVPENSGPWSLSEVAPSPGFVPAPGAMWVNTTDTSGQVSVTTGTTAGPDFGNVCLGAGGGKTLGFWSNKNGQAQIGAEDLAEMVALNLRNAAGEGFDPANYTAFRTGLLNANATNMAYMLSAQLAAMKLNVFNGLVDGSALVYAGNVPAGCADVVNAAGFISVDDLVDAADSSLGLYGLTLSGNEQRSCQEHLKNALDKANNNTNFVQATPCPLPDCPYAP